MSEQLEQVRRALAPLFLGQHGGASISPAQPPSSPFHKEHLAGRVLYAIVEVHTGFSRDGPFEDAEGCQDAALEFEFEALVARR